MGKVRKFFWKAKKHLLLVFGLPIGAIILTVIGFAILAYSGAAGLLTAILRLFGTVTLGDGAILYFFSGEFVIFMFLGLLLAYSERKQYEQGWLILEFLRANQEKENNTKSVILQQTIEPMVAVF